MRQQNKNRTESAPVQTIRLLNREIPVFWLQAAVYTGIYILVTRILFDRCCPFQILTGLPCPGCGLMHSGLKLITLQFSEAWRIQPCIFLWVPLILLWVSSLFTSKISGKILLISLAAVSLVTVLIYPFRMGALFPNYPMDYYSHNLLAALTGLLHP